MEVNLLEVPILLPGEGTRALADMQAGAQYNHLFRSFDYLHECYVPYALGGLERGCTHFSYSMALHQLQDACKGREAREKP